MKRVSIFLGAGFSKWAANLPVASQLFDFNIEAQGKKEEQKLELVTQLKKRWDEEHANGLAERFVASALSFPPTEKQAVIWYIVRRLTTPFIHDDSDMNRYNTFHHLTTKLSYGEIDFDQYERLRKPSLRRHVLWIDEPAAYSHPGVKKARDFLKERGLRYSGVITTNYDLLVEYSYNTTGFHYGIQGEQLSGQALVELDPISFRSSKFKKVHLNGYVPVAKLHGSISWDNREKYIDGRRGLTGNALIVAPVPEKEPPAELKSAWELSAKILSNTTHLIFFGYAFNTYDKAVLDHLRIYGANVMEVLLIDLKPNIDAARQIWQLATIKASLPPPDGDSDINDWITNYLGL